MTERSCLKTFLLIPLFLFLMVIAVFADDHNIKGRVTDMEEEPLIGATVMVKESGHGVVTDTSGYFSLSGLEEGSWTLAVNYIGYEKREVIVRIPKDEEKLLSVVLIAEVYKKEELLVTASLFERITRYQPTQTYQASDIVQRNTSSMGTLIDGEPGVAMRSFGHAPSRPVIRGMDGERIQVLQNGMKMGDISATAHDHAVILDPQTIDQLDIVRGPASLIYGSSAMGGIINAHSNDIPSGWASGSSGNLMGEGQTGMKSLSGSGRYTYGTDSWAATMRGSVRNTGNMMTPIGEIPGTDLQSFHWATGVAYRTEKSRVGASLQYSDQQYGIPDDPFDMDEKVQLGMQRIAYTGMYYRALDHDFWQGMEFRSSYNRYAHEETEIAFEEGEIVDKDIELAVDQDYGQAELLFQHGTLGVLDNGTAGFSLEYFGTRVGGEEALTPDARGVTLAGFVVEEIRLPNEWLFQSGLRVEWNRTESLANPDFPDAGDVRSQGILAGAAGLNKSIVEDVRFGIQLSRAHRMPSIEELFSDANHIGVGAYEIGDPALKNEVGYGVDLFLDYETNSRKVHLALYANRISNYITMVPTGETEPERGFPILEYRGVNAELLGGELLIKKEITEQWSISGQADYVHGTEIFEGDRNPLPFIPPFRLTGTTEYHAGMGWTRLNVRHVLAQNRVAAGEHATSGYTLMDVTAGVRVGMSPVHHITVTVDNLFDVTWRDHLSRIQQRDIPMMGRNIRLGYRMTF